jgi:hypothetical protein
MKINLAFSHCLIYLYLTHKTGDVTMQHNIEFYGYFNRAEKLSKEIDSLTDSADNMRLKVELLGQLVEAQDNMNLYSIDEEV